MKRHDHLIPLTHDHHHALAAARRLRRAADGTAAERTTAAQRFIEFYEEDTLLHFREEEEVVFPLVVGYPEAEAPLTRLMMDHLRIHGLVRALRAELRTDAPGSEALNALATTLDAHIRFEEKTMFPMIERLVEGALDSVELAPRDRSPLDESPVKAGPS